MIEFSVHLPEVPDLILRVKHLPEVPDLILRVKLIPLIFNHPLTIFLFTPKEIQDIYLLQSIIVGVKHTHIKVKGSQGSQMAI